jgi:anthranilate/para-aminobenzoate synthase component I
MTLRARELPLAPDALALARRLAHAEPDVALLWSASGDGPSFIAARPLASSNALDPEPELASTTDSLLRRAPRWVGLIPYEALRGLERPGFVSAVDPRPSPHLSRPSWWRLGAVVCVGERVTVIGDDPASVDALSHALLERPDPGPSTVHLALREGEARELHAERVRAALELIRQGQIYQVNLARRLDLDVRGDPIDLLSELCAGTRPPYAAAFRFGDVAVVCTSPELLLEQRGDNRILTQPIKGTRPRGRDAQSDERWRSELEHDPKEQAELNMIVDVERNDVGRVSCIGSVRILPPRVTTHGLVWHRHATVSGQLAPHVSRRELLLAMLPSGSVTGAPKVRAMEIISHLEPERRGLYTGGLGFINHAGEMKLAMAIRTLTIRSHIGHYFTGGGIVADSDPKREVEETLWKARQLFGRAGRGEHDRHEPA